MRNFPFAVLFLALSLIISGLSPLVGQDIGLSPGADGSLYPSVDMVWTYGASHWSGSVDIRTQGSSNTDKTPPGPGLSQSVTTTEKHTAASLNLLNYRITAGTFTMSPGLTVQADLYNIQELGFIDLIYASAVYRLFIDNKRSIWAARPGLSVSGAFSLSKTHVEAEVFYSPLFVVGLSQNFSSAAQGTTVFDTPVTNHAYTGTGLGAWGARASLIWDNPYVPLSLSSQSEGFTLSYTYIGLGGSTISSTIENITNTIVLEASLAFISLRGKYLVIGSGWDGEFTREKGTSSWSTTPSDLRVILGINLKDLLLTDIIEKVL